MNCDDDLRFVAMARALDALHRERDALAYAYAHRRKRTAAAGLLQLVNGG